MSGRTSSNDETRDTRRGWTKQIARLERPDTMLIAPYFTAPIHS
jgi:hypothetical protein